MVSCLGLALLAAVDLADEAVPDFVLASPAAVVEHCMSLSLFGMAISGHVGGCVAVEAEGLQASLTYYWHLQAIQGSWPSQWTIVVHHPDDLGGQNTPAFASEQFWTGSGQLLSLEALAGMAAGKGY